MSQQARSHITHGTPRVPRSTLRSLGMALLLLMPIVSLTNAWEFIVFRGFSLRLLDCLFLLLWLIAVLRLYLSRHILVDSALFLLLLATLTLTVALGMLFFPLYSVDIAKQIRFVQTILWGILALFFFNHRTEMNGLVDNIVIAGSIIGLSSVLIHLQDPNLHRIAGFFNSAGGGGYTGEPAFNSIGAVHSLAALLCLYSAFFRPSVDSWRQRLPIFCGLALNTIGLVLTNSRSAILALALSVIVLLFPSALGLTNEREALGRVIAYLSTLVIIGVVSAIISIQFLTVNRIFNTLESGTSAYESLTTRITLWNRGIELLFSKPEYLVIGYGYGSIQRFIGAESAHNFFLNIGLWLGIIGLVIILGILVWPVLRLIQSRDLPNLRIGLITLTNAVVVSLFGNILVNPIFGGMVFVLLYGTYATRELTPGREKEQSVSTPNAHQSHQTDDGV